MKIVCVIAMSVAISMYTAAPPAIANTSAPSQITLPVAVVATELLVAR